MPKNCLLITFDYAQTGRTALTYTAATLLSACKEDKDYNKKFTVEHMQIDMSKNETAEQIVENIHATYNLETVDAIALTCSVWSHSLIEPIAQKCREHNFMGYFILGGYNIQCQNAEDIYPSGKFFMIGYGEELLPSLFKSGKLSNSICIAIHSLNIEEIISPYLNGTIPVKNGQDMVHWESQRGCYYKCSFCAHRRQDNSNVSAYAFTNKKSSFNSTSNEAPHVIQLPMERIKQELDYFKKMNVKQINVLDPIFTGKNAKEILEYAISINLKAKFVFQMRFELLTDEIIDLLTQLNCYLEFGLQTVIEKEYTIINRKNNIEKVSKTISKLQMINLPFEVSLIYGLPMQTPATFRQSINFLKELGVSNIAAFPLMLLEGTKLSNERDKYNLVDDYIEDNHRIKHVVESCSFSRADWQEMHNLVKNGL